MIQVQLDSVSVKNVGPIKDLTIPIQSGTTLIRGHNQDAQTGGRQTNAVGKSLSISPIALGFTSSRPMLAPKRYQRSGAFQTAGSSTELKIKVNKVPYTLINRQKGNSFELQINKNDKDLKYRTLKIAEAARQELLPMTEEQFYSTVYLDMKRPSVIQAGTDAQRLDFLCRLFELNQLDVYRKRLLVKQQELVSRQQEQKTLAQELMDVEQRLAAVKWGPKAEARYQRLKEDQKALTEELAKLAKKVNQSAEAREQRKARAAAKKDLIPGKCPRLSDLKEQLRKTLLIEDQQKLFDGMQRQKRKMERLLDTKLPPAPKETIEQLEHEIALMRRNYRSVEVKKARKKPEGRKLSEAEYTKHASLAMLDAQELSAKCCPTCGQKVGNLAERVIESKALVKAHHRILLWNEYEQDRINAKALKKKMDALITNGKKVAEKLQLARKHQAQAGLRKAIVKIDKDFGKRPKVKGPSSDELRVQIEAVRKSKKAAKLLALPLIPLSATALEDHEKATTKLSVVGAALADLHSRRTEHRTLMKGQKELKNKVESFGDIATEERALTQLLKVLSNKGLKVDAANQMLKELQRRMNAHAQMLFVEPIEFKFGATPGKVSLLYQHQKSDNRRKHLWIDIRELSGQESRAFSLLFFCAVRPLLPKIQTDFVVLDEMDANMSQPTRDLFAKEFLPYLQTLIPKIIIATPDSNTAYSGRIVNLVKKDGVTRLVDNKGRLGHNAIIASTASASTSVKKKVVATAVIPKTARTKVTNLKSKKKKVN